MSSMYDCTRCPLCGELMWNGQCENLDCKYHWYPKDDDDEGEDYQGYSSKRLSLRAAYEIHGLKSG